MSAEAGDHAGGGDDEYDDEYDDHENGDNEHS